MVNPEFMAILIITREENLITPPFRRMKFEFLLQIVVLETALSLLARSKSRQLMTRTMSQRSIPGGRPCPRHQHYLRRAGGLRKLAGWLRIIPANAEVAPEHGNPLMCCSNVMKVGVGVGDILLLSPTRGQTSGDAR